MLQSVKRLWNISIFSTIATVSEGNVCLFAFLPSCEIPVAVQTVCRSNWSISHLLVASTHKNYNYFLVFVQFSSIAFGVGARPTGFGSTLQWRGAQRQSSIRYGISLIWFKNISCTVCGLLYFLMISKLSGIDEFHMVLGGQPMPFCIYPLSRVTRNCETRQHQQLRI